MGGIKPFSWILISDVDEIPDPNTMALFSSGNITNYPTNSVLSLKQDLYYYNLENRITQSWYYAKMLTWNTFFN